MTTRLTSSLKSTTQVQFSIIDQRPAVNLTTFCRENNITLLCYGSLLGGFLSTRWLGEKAPDPRGFTSSSEEKVGIIIYLII